MWRRLRRRSLGPRRPIVWREQVALAILSVTVLAVSAGYAIYAVFLR